MPQPPVARQRVPKSIEEAKDTATALQSGDMSLDPNHALKATLDEVVHELTHKVSELMHLTASLPHRLNTNGEGISTVAFNQQKHEVSSLVHTFADNVGTNVDINGYHYVVPNGTQQNHVENNSAVDPEKTKANQEKAKAKLRRSQSIEEAAENAEDKLESELLDDRLVHTPSTLLAIEHAAENFGSAMEKKVHHAILELDEVVEHSLCAKCVRMACPKFLHHVNVAARNEKDHLKNALNKEQDKFAKFSGRFDMAIGILILANCLLMAVQLEYVGYQSQISLGEREADGSWNNADTYFTVVEHIFNALFISELFVRYAMMGLRIFCDRSILLDMFLVAGSSVQIYIFDPMDVDGIPGINLSLFRMLRFVKFIKIFRLVRVLKLFSHLRVLVKTIASSFGALIWSMMLLLVIMVMSGMFLSGVLESFITNPENDLIQRKWVFKHYGTASRAVYTLFEVTLAGCWPNYIRPLIENVSYWYIVFAVFYISIVVFAIIRIITAIFLKETLAIASNDAEMMVQERSKQRDVYIAKLGSVFRAVDTSGDGTLSKPEFLEILENPLVKTWLQLLDLEVHDASALFGLLDNGDGEITYDEFLKGVMRLKGQARSQDIVAVMHSTDKTLHMVSCIMEQVLQVLVTLDPSFALPGTTSQA